MPTPPERRIDTCDMPDNLGCRWSDEAANRAVSKVFAILGVDIGDPQQVEAFREDLRFGRHMRTAANYGILAMIGTAASAIIVAIWYGIKTVIGQQ